MQSFSSKPSSDILDSLFQEEEEEIPTSKIEVKKDPDSTDRIDAIADIAAIALNDNDVHLETYLPKVVSPPRTPKVLPGDGFYSDPHRVQWSKVTFPDGLKQAIFIGERRIGSVWCNMFWVPTLGGYVAQKITDATS